MMHPDASQATSGTTVPDTGEAGLSRHEAQAALPERRYKLTIAYDGSKFHGWQKQHPPGQPPLRTVQGVVEERLRHLLKQGVILRGASRTDRGVHAFGQVGHFDARCPIPLERLPEAINARLPDDVEVRAAEVVPPDFESIGSARSKQYRYRVWNTPRRPLGLRHLVYHYWYPVDVARMNDAAKRLVGEHDFAGFAAAGHGRLSTVRTIHACHVEEHDACGEREVQVVVAGSGFLYHMVRIITGTLLDIGRGHWRPERIDEILAAADRRLAGFTAPPNGLYLEWIRYASWSGETIE